MMKSLREIVDTSPYLHGAVIQNLPQPNSIQALGNARWDWQKVQRILVVRLRSIGDTVLATPSLKALKRFAPSAQVDILLEDWVAPVLEGFEHVDDVLTVKRDSTASRLQVARQLRARHYDVAYNLHGGTTATLLIRASGARHRVGYAKYQYSQLHNHLAPAPSLLWGQSKIHSVEQQLGLIGWTGVPVTDRPSSHLAITSDAQAKIATRLGSIGFSEQPFALIHPAAAFATKQWPVEKFARVAEHLGSQGLPTIAILAPTETDLANRLQENSGARIEAFCDLSLPEVTALAARARIFVGNDSGIAHMVAAVGVPAVVIFGSSNVVHWAPWSKVPAAMVREEMDCQPCHGYFCEKFAQPECILRVPVERTIQAVDRLLRET